MNDEVYKKPYVISKTKNGTWYCHHRLYPMIPVIGSMGDKRKAMYMCKKMNNSSGNKKGKNNE